MSGFSFVGGRFEGAEPASKGVRLTYSGYLVRPLPDLATASLSDLREAEWSGREPCKSTTGAWHVCQCCGAAKIDGKGHAPDCVVAEAIERAERQAPE